MQMLVVSGSFNPESSSTLLAERAAEYADKSVDVDFLDPLNLDIQICDGRAWDGYNDDILHMQHRFDQADCYIFAIPVYNWSFSGGFKNLIDLIPPDNFSGEVAGFIGKSGGDTGFLMLHRELQSLMHYFNVNTVPEAVFATDQHMQNGRPDAATTERIHSLVDTLIDTTQRLTE